MERYLVVYSTSALGYLKLLYDVSRTGVLAIFLAVLLGIGISYFQDILPDFPGYASTLFSNAMVIGQLGGNLLGGAMSHWVGLENVFFVSAASIMLGMILIFFTKNQKLQKRM